MNHNARVACILLFLYSGSVAVLAQLAKAQKGTDIHRPECVDAQCRKVKLFIQKHYCGESPFANGPDDGCEIKLPKKPGVGIEVLADFSCEWSDAKQAVQCKQRATPSSLVRGILTRELRRLGLPAKVNGQTYFTVWKPAAAGWSLAAAYYSRTVGSNQELCQVILTIDRNSRPHVLRKLPFQTTDIDVPTVTQWIAVDLADTDGDGQVDVILEGNAYEDHWLEVVSVGQATTQTIFSGLGYYL